ncbi:galactose-binding domain-containing protein [Streptomyces sp. NPDC002867]
MRELAEQLRGEITRTSGFTPRIGSATERAAAGDIVLRLATQKSAAWDAPASRAVDGNTDGAFGSGSVTDTAEPSNQAWWQVDLGTSARVDQVQVGNRTDCCADRLKDLWMPASANPFTADGLDAARSAPGVTAVHVTSQAGRTTTVTLPPGTDARYVRVRLASSTNPLSLAEVQVRGARA